MPWGGGTSHKTRRRSQGAKAADQKKKAPQVKGNSRRHSRKVGRIRFEKKGRTDIKKEKTKKEKAPINFRGERKVGSLLKAGGFEIESIGN